MRVAVRLTPRSSADRIDGVARSPKGKLVLQVRVAAPPVEGRANEALLQLLAGEWRLPRRDLTLVGGARSRSKSVHIAGDTAALICRLGAAIGGVGQS